MTHSFYNIIQNLALIAIVNFALNRTFIFFQTKAFYFYCSQYIQTCKKGSDWTPQSTISLVFFNIVRNIQKAKINARIDE